MLAVGAPPARRPPLPQRLRALAAAALLVLGAGVAAAVDQQRPPPPPAGAAPQVAFPGVAADVALLEERELVTRLQLDVVVAGGGTGQGDTGGAPRPEQLRLVEVTSRGFQVRLVGRDAPLALGDIGRFGSGLRYVVPLGAEVSVVDCSVETGAQRRITLSLRRGDGPARPVVGRAGPGVVRALDDLVRRTCRRPRG